MDRDGTRGRVAAVDPADDLVDLAPESRIGVQLLSRRDGHLNDANAVLQVRVVLQQLLDREEAGGNAFRVVEPVDTYDDLAAGCLRQDGLHLLRDGVAGGESGESCGVDPHREDTQSSFVVSEGDAVDSQLAAEKSRDGYRKVTQV